jgi:hypothetical protein
VGEHAEPSFAAGSNRCSTIGRVSYVADEVFGLPVDCSCGWRGKISSYRQHLVREHCNVDGCFARAEALVSFGYRQPAFVLIGPRLGVCARHRAQLRPGHMHMIVEAVRLPSRR